MAFEYEMVGRGKDLEAKGKWTVTSGLLVDALQLGLGLLYVEKPCSQPLAYWAVGRFVVGLALRGMIGGILLMRGWHLEDKKVIKEAMYEAREEGDNSMSLERKIGNATANFHSPIVQLLIVLNCCWFLVGFCLIYKTGCAASAWSGECDGCISVFLEVISLLLVVDVVYSCVSFSFFWQGNVVGEKASLVRRSADESPGSEIATSGTVLIETCSPGN